MTKSNHHDEHDHDQHHAVALWLFIGAILMIYGVIIFTTGLLHFLEHQPFSTVLSNLQPDMVWGTVLFFVGSLFVFFNWRHYRHQSDQSRDR